VTLSMPAVIGRKGIIRTMKVELDEEEQKKLEMQDKAQGELDKAQEEVKKEEK
jgi:malate/lactate dehydrogenase